MALEDPRKETLQSTSEGRRRKRYGERERELSVHWIPDWLERGG